jgi:hypothetical protein
MRNVSPAPDPDGQAKRKEVISYIESVASQIPPEQLPEVKTKLKEAKFDTSALDEVRVMVDKIIAADPVIIQSELMTSDDPEINEIANEAFGEKEPLGLF